MKKSMLRKRSFRSLKYKIGAITNKTSDRGEKEGAP